MTKIFKKILHKILPAKIDEQIMNILFNARLKKTTIYHKRALLKIRKKEKITVVFLLIHESVWKYEELYKLMEKDIRFNPVVVVCPYIMYGNDTMLRDMRQAYNSFKKRNYNVIKSLNEKTGEWLDVKKDLKPDIVFFTNPWGLTRAEYLLQNFGEILTCYVPYGFKNSYLYESHFNKGMQNFVWKFFLETKIHKKLSIKYSRNKSANTIVTGYPGMDNFLKKDYKPIDVWKIKDKEIKRIIWAPHHTIPGMGATLDYSTFFKYCDFIYEIALKYKDWIQIAFKPHPVLRAKLNREEVWGKIKTDLYYQKWADLPNGQLHLGEYSDLFLTSDAMIHDSSSFVIEYLCAHKPVMFLINDESIYDRFNEIGKMALSKIYQGRSEKEIESFLDEVVLKNKDSMARERILFFNNIIKPPNNLTASENIFYYLKSEIFQNNEM